MPGFTRPVSMVPAALVCALVLVWLLAACGGDRPAGTSLLAACGFQKATHPVRVAFCDTFDNAARSNPSRSGALNPTVWGVSELSVRDNPSQGLDDNFVPATAAAACGGGTVKPPQNVQICNGRLFDTANDGGSQSIVAMYPRQPFDIAGRTGDVTFDVANDSLDGHAAWPSLVYTDQPVPAPYQSAAGIDTFARNSFGITFAGQVSSNCPRGKWSVDGMFETANYALSAVPFTHDACVRMSKDPTHQSHVEIQISPTSVVVWAASAPGATRLVKIAHAGVTMPLTRGLLWMEDVHYNAGKYAPGQENNTFGWDDFGFDGAVLPRDRGFDVPENTVERGGESLNTGWSWDDQSVRVQTLPVDAASLGHAQGALVEFDWFADDQTVPTISLNGHAPISTAWPFGDGTTYTWRTIAIQVPLPEVIQGRNTVAVTRASTPEGSVANFDLILQGAGGVPTCLDPSTCG